MAVCKDYAEIVGPIHGQARNSAVITAFIVLIVAGGWAYVIRTQKQKGKLEAESESCNRSPRQPRTCRRGKHCSEPSSSRLQTGCS